MADTQESVTPLLERIRQKEAEAIRCLAAARQTAEMEIHAAEQRACEMIMAAEAQGKQEGERLRQAILDETTCQAQAIIQQAQAEADYLLNLSPAQKEAAVSRVVAIVTGNWLDAAQSPTEEQP